MALNRITHTHTTQTRNTKMSQNLSESSAPASFSRIHHRPPYESGCATFVASFASGGVTDSHAQYRGITDDWTCTKRKSRWFCPFGVCDLSMADLNHTNGARGLFGEISWWVISSNGFYLCCSAWDVLI